MPRFVLLEHDYPQLHWDLMLEAGAMLQTWRLAAPPAPSKPILASKSLAHRRIYLDYEGPIGGNRGQVVRWDQGTFFWETYQEDEIRLRLEGERLQGILRLERTDQDNWQGWFKNNKS